jgi:hypothetical protein
MASPATKTGKPTPSFHYEVTMQSRRAFIEPGATAWILDNKLTAYRFASDLGLDVPITRLVSVSHTDLELSRGTVVKPLAGIMSKGVYILGQETITDLPRNRSLPNIEALRESIAHDLSSGDVADDAWIEERLVFSDHDPSLPARDIKFYCFYGVVGLVLETVRSPEVRRCWYGSDGQVVRTGKYTDRLFAGNGIPEGYIELAKKISLSVPAPFLRIDFLASPDGPVLNEFTPKPGGASQFDARTDKRLGSLMVSAAGRLHTDLVNGQAYPEFSTARLSLRPAHTPA